jgi:hypothetical protein
MSFGGRVLIFESRPLVPAKEADGFLLRVVGARA